MLAPEALRRLCAVLAQLYPDKVSATRIVDDVGVPTRAVAWNERAIDNWHAILKEVEKHNRLALLLEIVNEEYGENPAFRSIRQQLGNQLTTPPPFTPAMPDVAGWQLVHPYPMPPYFSGRVKERQLLSAWLERDSAQPLLQVRALGGFGKSALAWHWLTHDVNPVRWPRVIWWSFYESDSSFENFLHATLTYLGHDLTHLAHHRQAVDELLRQLTQPGLLLIVDGFERALRAFSSLSAAYQGDDLPTDTNATRDLYHDRTCISPHTDYFLQRLVNLPGLRSKVLMTTRLTPHSLTGHGGLLLQGCRELELRNLHPADAVTLFRSLGVRGNRGEIESACAAYGFHPLSLRLLAGLVLKDLQQPGDIVVSRRLNLTGNMVQRQHHVLEQAYVSLLLSRRQLLSILACFRSPVEYEVLKLIRATVLDVDAPAETTQEITGLSIGFDDDLHDLLERGLIQRVDLSGRFDLHPIVRRYTYDRLGSQQRSAVHNRLRHYFVTIEVPEQVRTLDELTPLIELYHHTVEAGLYDEAFVLIRDRLSTSLYYQFGAYELEIELLCAIFPTGEAQSPRLTVEADQGWVLNTLATSYSLSGQPHRAVPLFEAAKKFDEKRGDERNVAVGLGNLAYMVQLPIGALRAAEANMRHSINLNRANGDEYLEATCHQALGRLLTYRGEWAGAASELATALSMFEGQKHVQFQGVTTVYQALRELLLLRTSVGMSDGTCVQAALNFACRALALADETARTRYPHARDYLHAYWLLGASQRANGNLEVAERYLSEALTRCRSINAVEAEVDILNDLARLRRDQGQADEVLALVTEALAITERCGYVLQGADARLLLAELALAAGDKIRARQHAEAARDLAFCDGPPYCYKVAYEEALALLTACTL